MAMSVAIVDATGWQTTLDLQTGEEIETAGPVVDMVKDVLHRHPYPGDMDPGSNRWVTDTALDLIDRYSPRFGFLIYAAQYFAARYTPMDRETRAAMISAVFGEIQRLVDASGFAPLVIGTGGMIPLAGFIDLTGIDGLAICTHWSTRYAGLYNPSPDDMRFLEGNPNIDRIVPRDEVVRLFTGTPQQALKVPEYLLVAAEGHAFRTITDTRKTPVMIPSVNADIPLYAPGHDVENITDLRGVLEQALRKKKVLLVIVDGVGLAEFPWPHTLCRNGKEWCSYEPGETQCLTISSGRHRFLDYPTGTGYKYFDQSEETRAYPYSGFFKSIPEGTFARTFPGRSIAVGNKSMFMHMVSGADLSIECFARNLYNQGTMAVIHRQDKI